MVLIKINNSFKASLFIITIHPPMHYMRTTVPMNMYYIVYFANTNNNIINYNYYPIKCTSKSSVLNCSTHTQKGSQK